MVQVEIGLFSAYEVKAYGLDWSHDSIVQHEASHNFDESDKNYPFVFG